MWPSGEESAGCSNLGRVSNALEGNMATRELLALSKIDEFASWAKFLGYDREPVHGMYEVLRLRLGMKPPLIFFTRSTTLRGGVPIHATCQENGVKLVRRWIRERNNNALEGMR